MVSKEINKTLLNFIKEKPKLKEKKYNSLEVLESIAESQLQLKLIY